MPQLDFLLDISEMWGFQFAGVLDPDKSDFQKKLIVLKIYWLSLQDLILKIYWLSLQDLILKINWLSLQDLPDNPHIRSRHWAGDNDR